jgi:hypothetical protein
MRNSIAILVLQGVSRTESCRPEKEFCTFSKRAYNNLASRTIKFATKSKVGPSLTGGAMISFRMRLLVAMILACVVNTFSAISPEESQLSDEQMRTFLLSAKVVSNRPASKGITGVLRLTLSDGKLTHDAAFQSIDESAVIKKFESGRSEIGFRDSYKYNIAAYELARLLGLGDMMPVTVARKWGGKTGALSWWIPHKMDEEGRLKQQIEPPDPEAWNRQMYKARVFRQLVYDTDSKNVGNLLISEDWHLWMIDFTRAFRLHHTLQDANVLTRCDRQLMDKLRLLDSKELTQNTSGFLTKAEVEAVMTRRDKIVDLFNALVAQKGENEVLY